MHYVPVLRWKAGEERALRELSPHARSLTTPLLVVEPHEYDPPDQSAIDASFDSAIERDVQKLERAWQDAGALVDLNAIDGGALVNGSEHPVEYFFRTAEERGLHAVPVVWMTSDEDYVAATAEASRNGRGAVLRVFFSELDDLDLNAAVGDKLAAIGLAAEEVDLLLDLRALTHPVVRAVHAVLTELMDRRAWRSVTVSSGAFPQNLVDYAIGVHRLARHDWHFWQRFWPQFAPNLSYGDYCTLCPEPREAVDPQLMNPSASVKYTLENEWLVLRGSGVRTPGAGGFGQFAGHARHLVQMQEYPGPHFSYGDGQIQRIADGEMRPGNMTTWVTIAVNHHIEFVANQLAGQFANLHAA